MTTKYFGKQFYLTIIKSNNYNIIFLLTYKKIIYKSQPNVNLILYYTIYKHPVMALIEKSVSFLGFFSIGATTSCGENIVAW